MILKGNWQYQFQYTGTEKRTQSEISGIKKATTQVALHR